MTTEHQLARIPALQLDGTVDLEELDSQLLRGNPLPDPSVMAAQAPFASALSSLRAVWIDAGHSDEYFLDLGAAAFRRAVEAAGLPPSRLYFELFPAGHAAIEYRYPLAVAWLCQRMEASQP